MPVDIEQWEEESENVNWCLHYVIIELEINLFNIMVRASQVLALILPSACSFTSNNISIRL